MAAYMSNFVKFSSLSTAVYKNGEHEKFYYAIFSLNIGFKSNVLEYPRRILITNRKFLLVYNFLTYFFLKLGN